MKILQKYGTFEQLMLVHFIKHEPLISEEWLPLINYGKTWIHLAVIISEK